MEWRKVTESIPLDEQWVIGSDGEDIDLGIWVEGQGFSLPDLGYLRRNITHWMPLPELPQDD